MISIKMTSDYSSNYLKLSLKNKSIKFLWYSTNIQKDEITILSKHRYKTNLELTIAFGRKTSEKFSVLKNLADHIALLIYSIKTN